VSVLQARIEQLERQVTEKAPPVAGAFEETAETAEPKAQSY
jgi:hypothetical protein